jgi:hypothetical protein
MAPSVKHALGKHRSYFIFDCLLTTEPYHVQKFVLRSEEDYYCNATRPTKEKGPRNKQEECTCHKKDGRDPEAQVTLFPSDNDVQ